MLFFEKLTFFTLATLATFPRHMSRRDGEWRDFLEVLPPTLTAGQEFPKRLYINLLQRPYPPSPYHMNLFYITFGEPIRRFLASGLS